MKRKTRIKLEQKRMNRFKVRQERLFDLQTVKAGYNTPKGLQIVQDFCRDNNLYLNEITGYIASHVLLTSCDLGFQMDVPGIFWA